MEKFRITCKKCNSENVKLSLSVRGYDEEGLFYAVLELKCLNCVNKEELEEVQVIKMKDVDFRNWIIRNIDEYPYFKNIKIRYNKQKYLMYLEGWNNMCFTDIQNIPYDEIKDYDDHELEDLAIEVSHDIKKQEKWHGLFYYYSDEIGNSKYPYGVTVFYKVIK